MNIIKNLKLNIRKLKKAKTHFPDKKTKKKSNTIYETDDKDVIFVGTFSEFADYKKQFDSGQQDFLLELIDENDDLISFVIQTKDWNITNFMPRAASIYSVFFSDSNIIIHNPHSSLFIPAKYKNDFILSEKALLKENLSNTDLKVDYLIEDINKYNMIRFNYSRLVLDVEKLSPDILDKKGRGRIYTSTMNGDLLRVVTKDRLEELDKIYKDYHSSFRELCSSVYKKHKDKALIIDLHSFPENESDVDICIGFNDEKSKKTAKIIAHRLQIYGFSVEFNNPYSNSIQPIPEIRSVMIEINKRLYLNGFEYRGNSKLSLVLSDILNTLQLIEE